MNLGKIKIKELYKGHTNAYLKSKPHNNNVQAPTSILAFLNRPSPFLKGKMLYKTTSLTFSDLCGPIPSCSAFVKQG